MAALCVLPAAAQPDKPSPDLEAIVAKIQAYEDLFDTFYIHFRESGRAARATDLGSVESEVIIDGARQFRVNIVTYNDNSRTYIKTVKSGNRVIESRYSDAGGNWEHATLPSSVSVIQDYLFQPFEKEGLGKSPKIEIRRQSDKIVELRFTKSDELYIDAAYEPSGQFLRPLRIEFHPIENGQVRTGSQFVYSYTRLSEAGEGPLPPSRIEQINDMHGVYDVFHIYRLDLDPAIPGDLFDLPEVESRGPGRP